LPFNQLRDSCRERRIALGHKQNCVSGVPALNEYERASGDLRRHRSAAAAIRSISLTVIARAI
jgi:hypothetical protein